MKKNVIIALGCMSLFAVSCAHKQVQTEPVKISQEIPVTNEMKTTETKVEKKSDSKNLSYNCVVGNDSRTITLQKDDKRCEVHYTKSGNLNNIAWAEQTPSICDRVFDQVRSNIENGGFKCADDGQKTASNR